MLSKIFCRLGRIIEPHRAVNLLGFVLSVTRRKALHYRCRPTSPRIGSESRCRWRTLSQLPLHSESEKKRRGCLNSTDYSTSFLPKVVGVYLRDGWSLLSRWRSRVRVPSAPPKLKKGQSAELWPFCLRRNQHITMDKATSAGGPPSNEEYKHKCNRIHAWRFSLDLRPAM